MSSPGPRVRFAPSPTGDLHVGNVRTALYNWAQARRHGGVFVFRLEDTDRSRSSEEACAAAIDTLRWLGLDWDEGVEVGGPDGPYRQTERYPIYREWTERFLSEGTAYHCYCTQDEVAERARAAGRPPGYDGHCRRLTGEQLSAYRQAGREPVVRLKMPPGTTEFDDLVRGRVSFDNATVPDFVLVRADGHPLYTLAVAVDDVAMRITQIIRGEDLLSSTPRQVAVYRAMGVPESEWPSFAHLPMVLGPDGQRLSKRNGVVSIAWYRAEGFLPEAICNYLALLGWAPEDGGELFGLAQLRESFSVERVNRNPARFDVKKLESINGEKIRALPPDELVARIVPFLERSQLISTPPGDSELRVVRAAAPLLQTRIRRLSEASRLLYFLLVPEPTFSRDSEAVAQTLGAQARPILQLALDALRPLARWTEAEIQSALRSALSERALTTKAAFPALYTAVTGYRSGLPLFDSLALLGRDATLGRLQSACEVA
jgi:glutamyl-tRNA synthetase